MKKSLLFAGLAAATLAFVGCNKEADVKGLDATPMGIILTDATTRTVNDGMSTNWEDGDALNVFYAPAGSTDYSENIEFTVDDAAANHATGSAELTAPSYDWYLLYPYSSYIKTPANTSAGYLAIGSQSNKTQTQAGLNSTAHLAGANLPVWGVAKDVKVDVTPKVAMKHVSSVVKVTVTNALDKAITVSSISLTAPEDIVGTYYIDFSGDAPAFKGSGKNYVSTTATLEVTDAEALAPGASASFYMAVKPFTAAAESELAIKILADAGTFEKTVVLDKETEFKAGFIKTLNVSYSSAQEFETITIADIKEMVKDGTNSNQKSFEGKLAGAVVTYVSGRNAFIQDETAGILFYNNSNPFKVGDKLEGVVSGSGYSYNGLKEIVTLTVETTTPDQAVPAAVEMSLEELNADYDRYESVLVTLKDVTVTTAFDNRNATMTDGDVTMTLRDQKNGLTIDPGVYDITGFPSYYNAPQFGVWEQDAIVKGDAPFLNAVAEQSEVFATTTSVKINVSGNVAWTAEASPGATLDKEAGEGTDVITVSFAENTDPNNAKEYTVFVRTDDPTLVDAGQEEFEINITQAKADAADVKTVTSDFSARGYENQEEVVTVTDNGVTATFDKGTNSNTPKYFTTGTAIRVYGGGTMTVNAGGKTMVSIELTFGSGDGSNEITTNVPTYEEPTWTGEAGSVTFTVGGTSGHRRIKAITVKYTDDDAPVVTPTLESIAVSGQTTTFTVGDTFTFDGKVTATYSDGSTKEVQPTEVSKPDMTTAGTQEVTVSYTEKDATATTSYEITVNEPVEEGGTLENPYTVAQAMAATEALGEGKTSKDAYYTKGIISDIVEVTPDYGNATYFISDDGTTDSQFKVFRGKFIGNTNFTAEDQIQVGDEVLVYGKLSYYKPQSGASEIEVASGNYIYSLKRNGADVHALGASISAVSVGSSAATLTLKVFGDVAWTASATNGASVSPSSGTGIGEATVSIPANTTAEVKTYKVSVTTTAAVDNKPVEFTVTQAAQDNSNQWVATSLSQIIASDVFVIVSTNADGESFAMTNNNGTGSAPTAKAVTVDGDKLSGTPEDILQWSLGGSEGAYVFYVAGDTSKWLYVTNTNNGVRVGTNEDNTFSIVDNYLFHNGHSRYLGVYNKQDWRSYTSINNNIKDQTFTFFVKKSK